MLQTLTDKFADSAVPLLVGTGIWVGTHYAVLTPRIMMVDLPKAYAHHEYSVDIPHSSRDCVTNNVVETTLKQGRIQAAIYTASFRHIANPFHKNQAEVETLLNEQCGVNHAIAAAKAQQEHEEYLAKIREAQRIKEEGIARAKALKEKAEKEARDRAVGYGLGILGLIMGASQQ